MGIMEEINPKKIFDFLHDDNGVTVPMILFGFSIGLFIGKFIKFLLTN